MATLTANRAPLTKFQFDFVEPLDINSAGDFGMWNHVQFIEAGATLGIATEPGDAAGRRVLQLTSAADAKWAYLKTQQQYSANNSVDANPAGLGTTFKMMWHSYITWDNASQITTNHEMTIFKLLFGGNPSTNATMTLRFEGSPAGDDAQRWGIGFYDSITDGSHNVKGTYDLDMKGKWCTILLEWQDATGGGSNGICRVYLAEGMLDTAADVKNALWDGADGEWVYDSEANWDSNRVYFFDDLTTDNGASQVAWIARNNVTQGANTTTVCVASAGGTCGFDDITLDSLADPEIVNEPMVGQIRDVSTTAANVFVRSQGGYHKAGWHTDAATRASVRYWKQSENESEAVETAKVALTAAGWWANTIRISGLVEDTDYYFRVRLYDTSNDADYVDAGHTLDVKLLPVVAKTLNCMHIQCSGEDGRMLPYNHFAVADGQGIRYVFYTDDIGYQDDNFRAETVDEFKLGFMHFFSDPDLCKLARKAAFFYKLGDHQTRNDAAFSDRSDSRLMNDIGFSGYGAATTVQEVDEAGREAFYDWFIAGMEGILTDGGAWNNTEMYRVIASGHTLFVFPNDVQFRDPTGQTLWRATQEAALKTAISDNARPLIVMFGVRYNGPDGGANDFVHLDNYGFSTYHSWRNSVEAWFAANVASSKVLWVTADRHFHEANTRFQAGVDGRLVDMTDQFILEWTTGAAGWRQWDIDLSGAVGTPAEGAETRLSQYTPGGSSATFMRVWTAMDIAETTGAFTLKLYDNIGTSFGTTVQKDYPLWLRVGGARGRDRSRVRA